MFCDPLVFRFIPESGNLKLLSQGERLNLDFDEDHRLSIISVVMYGGFSNRPVFGKNPIQCVI
jgi:hypothetical protein